MKTERDRSIAMVVKLLVLLKTSFINNSNGLGGEQRYRIVRSRLEGSYELGICRPMRGLSSTTPARRPDGQLLGKPNTSLIRPHMIWMLTETSCYSTE